MRALSLALLLAAVVTGCGDDEQSTVASTSTRPTSSTTTSTQASSTTSSTTTTDEPSGGAGSGVEAATAVLTSQGTPRQACDLYVTERFIETAYGGRENCIASRTGGALARGLALGPAIEEGATHLVVIPAGGPYDGAKVEVDLVRDGDTYRVDSLLAHVPAGP
jgi:hypothetical protein